MAIVYVALVFGIVAALGILLAAWSLTPVPLDNAQVVEGRLRVYEGGRVPSLDEVELQSPFRDRVVLPVVLRVRHFITQRLPERERLELHRRLTQAGRPGGMTASDFVAARYAATLAVCLIGGLLGLLTQVPVNVAIGAALGAVVGLYAPMFWLRRRVNSRRMEIQSALPDALDLLVVCVEAGLSFEAAMGRVAEKLENAMGEEFGRVLQEGRLGKPRLEALDDLGRRTGVEDLHSFVQAVIQSEQLGSGVAKMLRIQSDEIRAKRVLRAQERGARASLKMLLPMVACIFPTLWIILLGPAALLALKFLRHG
ncbi:MAG: type II secretion system F family protein [Chloroflexi bacterium]|nr:MAG: type II secretion system F family protein [Chloroflexota bacterium]TMC73059.1 MAG: type II secretion system F family protein [Chloroflexota bacterium]